jgi:CHAT domain-containing protein
VYVPSGTVYATLRGRKRPPGRGLVALGDPAYPAARTAEFASVRGLASLPRLPATADEVESIGKLFEERTLLLREKASPDGLRAALSGPVAALHLACHGHVDPERPRLTGLVLADGAVLTVDDVYRLEVPADLVVLSACETGRGKPVRGEGVVGLVRAFFYAGAPRVVVSDWKVPDKSTRDLMVAFYTHLRTGKLAPAAALRAAKLEIMKEYPHPYHWAGFVLWGLE